MAERTCCRLCGVRVPPAKALSHMRVRHPDELYEYGKAVR